jgi:hypothetical protein
LFLLGLWGSCQTAPQSFNHVFSSFETITFSDEWDTIARTCFGPCRRDSLLRSAVGFRWSYGAI